MDVIKQVKNHRIIFDAIRRAPILYGRLKVDLDAVARATLAERKAFVDRRLDAMLGHAAEKTAYGRANGAPTLAGWPILEKERLRSHEAEFLGLPRLLTCRGQTSGTTGIPLTVFRSLRSLVVEQICYDQVIEGHGFDPRTMRTAVLRGDVVKHLAEIDPPFGQRRESGRALVFSSNHLSAASVRHYVDELAAYAPDCLFAYPSSLHSLCALMEIQGLSLRIPLVVTSSEVLGPETIALARRVLGCATADYYGQAERVAFAASHDGGEYRFAPGYAHVELRFSHQEGEQDLYEVIGTALWNTAMPLVRFRTGDLIATEHGLGETALDEIRYGVRGFPRVVGRKDSDGYIDAPDGTRLVGVTRIMYGIHSVYQWQIVQNALDDVRLLVIPKAGFTAADEERILASARHYFPESMRLRIEVTDRLERTRTGKSPFIIRARAA